MSTAMPTLLRPSIAAASTQRACARTRRAFAASLVISIGGFCAPALADLRALQFTNPIEQAAALANQGAYDRLSSGASPICDPESREPSGSCTGVVFQTFANVRELVETANGLSNSGSTTFSLGLNQQELGFALRWTAPEELAAQGSAATQFTNSQLGSLASRISALRMSALGRTAHNDRHGGSLWALGGGASADDSIAKRWGGFVNGAYGYGRKDDTTDPFGTSGTSGAEDAFDFDGREVTLGIDYRLRDNLVFGALLGFSDRRVDFDSAASIVDGDIDTDGSSLIIFALWESDRFYVSGSVGGQWLGYDLSRRITFPSHTAVESVDATATSNTDSDTLTGTLNAGVNLTAGGFTFEPYAKADYQSVRVDAFAEQGTTGFELGYDQQDIKSFELAAGIKLQRVFSVPFGVIVPYARAELRNQLEDDRRTISATYAGLPAGGGVAGQDFNLATDQHDDQYTVIAGGCSVVFKHGLQGFLQYQQVLDLETITERVIAAGVRLEF